MKNYVINGKFFSQAVTGVQRYAREILSELDKVICEDDQVVLAINKDAKDVPHYQSIIVKQIGSQSGNLWEQIELPQYVLKSHACCINLCNMYPILTPHIVAIHDISFKVNPKFFSKSFALWYQLVYALSVKRIKTIITVSQFSKQEIVNHYHIEPDKITVIPNAWQHIEHIVPDNKVLAKYTLQAGEYYFALSSMSPNKNFKWIAETAQKNLNSEFVVAGSLNKKVFSEKLGFECPPNMKLLGYISDEEAKALMQHCKAFLFPSLYEGFGIPPLEAMSVGADVIVSDTSCMREVYEDAVHYINPHQPCGDLEALLAQEISDPQKILDKYNWRENAKKMAALVNALP